VVVEVVVVHRPASPVREDEIGVTSLRGQEPLFVLTRPVTRKPAAAVLSALVLAGFASSEYMAICLASAIMVRGQTVSSPQNEFLVRQAEKALLRSEERFRLLVEGVKDYAIFMLDPQGHVVTWNAGAQRIKGYRAEEIVGEHFSVFYTDADIERRYPDEELRIAAAEGSYEDEGLRVGKDGSTFWANVVITALRDDEGNLRGFAKVTRDMTERKEAAERERLLAQEQAARDQAAEILESISDAFYAVDHEWRLTYVNRQAEELWSRSREELLGKSIWGEFPAWADSEFSRQIRRAMEERSTTTLETAFLVPGAWIAVRAYPSRTGLSVYFQDITERKQEEGAQRFLAEAGDVLSSSLDYRATLASVARLAVPTLADWCAVDILAADGSVERLATAHEDPDKVSLAIRLQEGYPTDPEAASGVPNVLRTGRPELYPEVTDATLEAVAQDPEHLDLLREIGFTSVIIVPMVARERTLGAVTLVSAESGRRYGESDLGLAEELARRAAMAVDNARLYEEARREISERERAEAEVRASRDQLEAVLGGVADGVTAQDAAGRLIYANETAAKLVGYPSARDFIDAPVRDVMGRFEVFDQEGRLFPLDRLPGRRALQGEEGAEEVLRFRVLATGEDRWAFVRAAPVFDERGEARVAVNIFRDITERRRAEEAMREVREAERNRMARDLHDGVLQDLSYTAASIGIMMLEAEGTKLEGQLQGVIDAIRRAAQGLREAVYDLRIEEQLDRPFPELVESLVRRNRSMARGYEISLEVEEGFPTYPFGDTGAQLWRVLQEALTNARRHSRADKVSVVLKTEGGDLIAEVSDDGRGFGPESAPGVGRSSMRERAVVMGGELQIKSEPGRGTRVRLWVPLPKEIRK
jgi:PAS domain S-box-containing protein